METVTLAGHLTRVTNEMYALQERDELCDVSLVTAGDTIKTHGVLLAASSPKFKLLLQKAHVKNHCNIEMGNYSRQTIQEMVRFVYTAEMKLSSETVDDLINILQEFELFEAVKLCEDFKMRVVSCSVSSVDMTTGANTKSMQESYTDNADPHLPKVESDTDGALTINTKSASQNEAKHRSPPILDIEIYGQLERRMTRSEKVRRLGENPEKNRTQVDGNNVGGNVALPVTTIRPTGVIHAEEVVGPVKSVCPTGGVHSRNVGVPVKSPRPARSSDTCTLLSRKERLLMRRKRAPEPQQMQQSSSLSSFTLPTESVVHKQTKGQAILPVKRGRGRPRKFVRIEKNIEINANEIVEQSESSTVIKSEGLQEIKTGAANKRPSHVKQKSILSEEATVKKEPTEKPDEVVKSAPVVTRGQKARVLTKAERKSVPLLTTESDKESNEEGREEELIDYHDNSDTDPDWDTCNPMTGEVATLAIKRGRRKGFRVRSKVTYAKKRKTHVHTQCHKCHARFDSPQQYQTHRAQCNAQVRLDIPQE